MTIDIKDCKQKIEHFACDKTNLIEKILKTINNYRQINNIPENKAISLDTATITRYIAYETFDYIIGVTRNSEWHKLYSKIEKVLRKVCSKRGLNWVILPKTKNKLEMNLQNEMKRFEQEKKELVEDHPTSEREITESKKNPLLDQEKIDEKKGKQKEEELEFPIHNANNKVEEKETVKSEENCTTIEDKTEVDNFDKQKNETKKVENQESSFVFTPKFKLKRNEAQIGTESSTTSETTKISLNIVVEDYLERVTHIYSLRQSYQKTSKDD